MPGFLLQSVIIGGGYATGRELVEFFLSSGPRGGLLGIVMTTVLFSIASALSFEFARLTRSFNYRSFFEALLGKGWFLYEICYYVLALLILAVIAAAGGEMIATHLGGNRAIGTILLVVPIGILVFRGTRLIERAMAGWSFLLYVTYAMLVGAYLWAHGEHLFDNLAAMPVSGDWAMKGISYFGYNLATIPLILFCVKHMESRKDAVVAGLLAGPLAMLPALMFFFAMAASYPAILDAAVPADFMLQQLHLPWLRLVFYVVVFGTFIETGTALIHAFNERLELSLMRRQRTLPDWFRPTFAVVVLLIATMLALRFGIIGLIARGYGTLTWGFVLVFALPLCTVGLGKIYRASVGVAHITK